MPRHPTAASSLAMAVLPALAWLLAAAPGQAQSGEQLHEFILRTGEIVAIATDLVHETENHQARRILQEARTLHERSLDFLARGQFRMALSTSQRARAAAQHAARLARETQGHQERLQLRLERFEELRDQIRDRVRESGNERARRFLHEAEQQALRAHDHFRQGNPDLALHLLGAAEDLLARAARLLFEGAGGERLEREIERIQAVLDRTAEQVQQMTGPRRETGLDLLASATEALRRAEEFRERQQPVRALHSLRLARQLTAQAGSLGDPVADEEAVAHQLARWDERLEIVAELVSESGSPPAVAALERAKHHRDQAGRRLEAGEIEPALRQLRAAFDLLNEASDLAR